MAEDAANGVSGDEVDEGKTKVDEERLDRYLALTNRARAKSTPLVESDSEAGRQLAILMRMADDYTADASYFKEKGDYVRSFAAINYAHAWIDAAVKLRLLDGHGDDELFTLP